jgi:thiol-disulfide isomerase/thioredoxin
VSPLRRTLLLAGVGGLAAAAGYGAHLFRIGGFGDGPSPELGRKVLESRVTGLDGMPASLTAHRGRILVVNYWATWCAPCREEIPMFVRLQREYAAKNVQFVGIAIDQADKVREFAKEFKVDYPLVIGGIDAMDLSREAGNKAGVLPYTLVMDPANRIVAHLVGGISEERMRATLQPLLK